MLRRLAQEANRTSTKCLEEDTCQISKEVGMIYLGDVSLCVSCSNGTIFLDAKNYVEVCFQKSSCLDLNTYIHPFSQKTYISMLTIEPMRSS